MSTPVYADYIWLGTEQGNWADATRWQQGFLPQGGDTTVFNAGADVIVNSNTPGVNHLYLGRTAGTASMQLFSGGVINVNTDVRIGDASGAVASLAVAAGATYNNMGYYGNTVVGGQGSGTMTNAGTVNVSPYSSMTVGGGTSGTYVQTGGATNAGYSLSIASNGTIEIQAGTLSSSQNLDISPGSGTTASLTQSGGSSSFNSRINVGQNPDWGGTGGTATLNLSGGTMSSSSPWNGGISVYRNSSINLSDTGTLQGPVININQGTFNQTGGTLNNNGTTTISGQSGYQGLYNLSGGTASTNNLVVNQYGIFRQTGGVFTTNRVSDIGGTYELLGGQFNATFIEGSFHNQSGTFSPGASPGVLSITGNYSQGADATLLMEFVNSGLGEYDVINATGAVTLAGTLVLDFTSYVGEMESFLIVNSSSGLTNDLANVVVHGYSQDNVQLNFSSNSLTVTMVPEPSSLLILSVGAVLMIKRRRRTR